MSYKITWKTHVVCLILAFGIRFMMGSKADNIVEKFILQQFMLYPTKFIILNMYLWVLLLMVPISIVHEFIHGTMYSLFGGKVRYGFKFIYAYTQEITGKPIHKIEFIAILLMPTLIITIVCFLMPAWLGGMVFFLNLIGASGDIYMTLLLLKYNNKCKVIDRSYGFDIV